MTLSDVQGYLSTPLPFKCVFKYAVQPFTKFQLSGPSATFELLSIASSVVPGEYHVTTA